MIKKRDFARFMTLSSAGTLGVAAGLLSGSCSTGQVVPEAAPLAVPPAYVQVPHPAGYDIGDLRAIMMDAHSPKPDEIQKCDADIKKLKAVTQSEPEIAEGVRELIKGDPLKYHWCFYGKVLELEDMLKTESFVDERQKKTLDTYAFLVPVSRAFLLEFHDSRYTRWAVKHYRTISEWVFYRKLELSPQATVDMAEATNPFGFLRDNSTAPRPVLEKYNIAQPVSVVTGGPALPGTPAAAPAPTAPTAPADPVATLPATQTMPAQMDGGGLDSLLTTPTDAARAPANK
jgi:hypothetical protein